MNLQDVLEEIIEKLPNNTLSVPSIIRKITQVRDDLIRNYGPAQQQSEAVLTTFDLKDGVSQYPIPCPPGNVVDVDVKIGPWWGSFAWGYWGCNCADQWVQPEVYFRPQPEQTTDSDCWFRLPYRQFDERYFGPYYYFLNGTIGILPKPCKDVSMGLKIFHIPVLAPLTVAGLGGPTGFDPNYDMVLVYGVLKEVTTGNEAAEYTAKYERWRQEYESANNGYERYVVQERW